MVLCKALLIDGMSAFLLIIFMAASREHVQSSGFVGLLLLCLLPAVMLRTQAVVSVLTKDLEQLFPASSSMSWPCCGWPSVFTKLYVPDPIPFQSIHLAIAVIADSGHSYYNDTYFVLQMGGLN